MSTASNPTFPSLVELGRELKLPSEELENLRHSAEQFARRYSKIAQRKSPTQESWLLCAIDPLGSERNESVESAVTYLSKMANALPHGGYRVMLDYIADEARLDKIMEKDCTVRFSVAEGMQIVVLPRVGICAMRSPSKSLKQSLEHYDYIC